MKLLAQWAVTSGILILIVLLTRYFFPDRLSARPKYALWAVVLARLLVPFQVALPASVSPPLLASNLAPEVGQWEERSVPVFPQRGKPISEFDPAAYDQMEPGEIWSTETSLGYYQRSQDGGTITWYLDVWSRSQIVLLVWRAGVLGMGIALLASNLRFAHQLRKRRRPLEGADAPLPVYAAEGLPSPCLFGLFRPAVYLTPEAAALPEEQRRHILAHELTHRAHRDHLWSLLRCLALALHWYNPLVWLAAVLSKGDGELACDEGAVARLGEEERVPYGRTLVDMVARRSARPADLLSCSTAMTGGKKSIQRRVTRLVKHPKTVRAAVFAAAAVMALAAVFVFASRQGRTRNDGLLDFLDRTTAISYAPPLYSSTLYPHPISDEALLAQAKAALSGFTYLESGDPSPDLREAIHESRVILVLGDREVEYSLLWQNDRTYLFTGSILRDCIEFKEENGENFQLEGVSGTCVSEEGNNVIAILRDLARQ